FTVERVPESGEALSGLRLLANAANRIAVDELLELPLGARRRAAVQRTLQRRERGDHAVVEIRVGRDGAAQREGRCIELVIGEQHERHSDEVRAGGIETPRFGELKVNGAGVEVSTADEP